MTERPGGPPFINRLPQSVVDRFEAEQTQPKTASVDEPYLHYSNVLFEPGDQVLPISQVPGKKSPYDGNNPHYSPDHVYLFKASQAPESFRQQGGALYEVEPHGEVEQDPEPFRKQGPTPGSYRTQGPVTVKRMVSNNWRDPKENIPEGLRGPSWAPSEQPRAKTAAKGDGVDTCKHCGSTNLWGNHFDKAGEGVPDDTQPGAKWDVLCQDCGKFQIRRNS